MASVNPAPCLLCCARSQGAARSRMSRLAQVHDQKRFAVTVREVAREHGPRRDFRAAGVDQDQAGVGVAHIPFRALRRIGERRLFQMRILGQQSRRRGTILGPTAFRAPAAVVDTARERHIEHRAVDAGLSAGQELHRANVAGGAPIYWNEIPGRLVFPHPEERAISAFTRVFDALWRASKDEGRGISGASFEARADARAPQDEESGRKSHRQSRISLPLNPSYLLLARQFHEKRKPAAKRQRPLTPTLSPQAGRGSVKASREGIFIFTSPQWGEVARRSSEGAKAWRVRGIRRCRFARSVPPLPPRTFGARLPLPTGERESVTGRKCRVLQRKIIRATLALPARIRDRCTTSDPIKQD